MDLENIIYEKFQYYKNKFNSYDLKYNYTNKEDIISSKKQLDLDDIKYNLQNVSNFKYNEEELKIILKIYEDIVIWINSYINKNGNDSILDLFHTEKDIQFFKYYFIEEINNISNKRNFQENKKYFYEESFFENTIEEQDVKSNEINNDSNDIYVNFFMKKKIAKKDLDYLNKDIISHFLENINPSFKNSQLIKKKISKYKKFSNKFHYQNDTFMFLNCNVYELIYCPNPNYIYIYDEINNNLEILIDSSYDIFDLFNLYYEYNKNNFNEKYNIFPDDLKKFMVKYKNNFGSDKTISTFKINKSNLDRWSQIGVCKKIRSGRKTKDPEMEKNIIKWLIEVFTNLNYIPNFKEITYIANFFMKKNLKLSIGWHNKFLYRNYKIYKLMVYKKYTELNDINLDEFNKYCPNHSSIKNQFLTNSFNEKKNNENLFLFLKNQGIIYKISKNNLNKEPNTQLKSVQKKYFSKLMKLRNKIKKFNYDNSNGKRDLLNEFNKIYISNLN